MVRTVRHTLAERVPADDDFGCTGVIHSSCMELWILIHQLFDDTDILLHTRPKINKLMKKFIKLIHDILWSLVSYAHSKLMTLLNLILRKIVKIILFFNITLWWPFVADGSPLSPCSTVRLTAVNWSFWGYRFRFLKFETSSESTRHGGMYDQGARSFGSINGANGFHSVRKYFQQLQNVSNSCIL